MDNDKVEITLVAARTNAHLTQEELAEKIGVSRMTVSNWEIGKCEPSLSQARLICQATGIPLNFLVTTKASAAKCS